MNSFVSRRSKSPISTNQFAATAGNTAPVSNTTISGNNRIEIDTERARSARSLDMVELGDLCGRRVYYSNLNPWTDRANRDELDPEGLHFVAVGWHVGFRPNGGYTRRVQEGIDSGYHCHLCLNSPGEFAAYRERFPTRPCSMISELFFFYLRHDYGNTFHLGETESADKRREYDAAISARRDPGKRRHLAAEVQRVASIAQGRFSDEETEIPNVVWHNDRLLTQAEMNDVYAKSETAMMLSSVEGANRSTVEYLLAGLPVISTECKGGRELFLDEHNSILVKNRPDDIARMKQEVREGVELSIENLRRGIFSRDEIRKRALRRLRWFYDRWVEALAFELYTDAATVRNELNPLVVDHAPSMQHLLDCDPLPPSHEVAGGAHVFFPSGSGTNKAAPESAAQPRLRTYIRFAGMKRHGNHAVINWLLSQYEGRIVFRNNAGKTQNLVNTTCDGIEAFKTGKRVKADLESSGDKRLFLVTFEDFDLERVFAPTTANDKQWISHQIEEKYEVVVLRDPFNYFASRLQGELNGDFKQDLRFSKSADVDTLIEMWKEYALWFQKFERSKNPHKIAINYNRWVISRRYRDEICEQFGIANRHDDARKLISGWGGGSSFRETSPRSSSDYFLRWRKFSDHPIFDMLARDNEIVAQTYRLFGDTMNQEAFIGRLSRHRSA